MAKPVFLLKKLFFDEVEKLKGESGGGMVSCHAHLDRAFTVNEENWEQSKVSMEEKWKLVNEIRQKNAADPEMMKERVRGVLEMMIEQGISFFHTHVDADLNTDLKVVHAMNELKVEYKDRIALSFAAHPTQGFLNEDGTDHDSRKIEIFEKACDLCDLVGGLPSADRGLASGGGLEKHMDVIFGIAKNLGKDLDVHIDQENNPYEKDTEKLIEKVREHGWEGRTNFLHCISVAAQVKSDRTRIIAGLKDVGANVIVCPTVAVAMRQHDDKMAPLHNSIAPVPEMVEGGVNVSIGLDNISDVYDPDSSGVLWDEVRLMAVACRYYEPEMLAKIATVNGYKIFNK
ncbi:amidohydrolase family protein [Candidatus Peregrinibacteria bacterium]|jgi:cytosine/creatinine deaminase|nr:amidohydrolase family protein [Candidatus Peregrinibacteria bacterium]MBT4056326.1 amidohydrolase family protein [Candidatus Peregrinibacteria bacterium]